MGVVPSKPIDRVQWYQDHLAPLTTNAVACGTSASAVSDLSTKTAAARSAYDDALALRQAAKAATETFYDAVAAMSTAGAAIIKQVRAKAESSGSNLPYTLSQIPSPATPTVLPPPGVPRDFSVKLVPASGSLNITWKCTNPPGGGVQYKIERRFNDDADFTLIHSTGQRKFVDAAVPAGTKQVTYRITGTRTTSIGEPATFLVQFGVGGGGETIASVATSPKLAA